MSATNTTTTWSFTFLNADFTIAGREAATADRILIPELWTATEWILLLTLGIAVLMLMRCMLQGAFCLTWPEASSSSTSHADAKMPMQPIRSRSSQEMSHRRSLRSTTRPPPRKTIAPVGEWNTFLRRVLFFTLVHATAAAGTFFLWATNVWYTGYNVTIVLTMAFYFLLTVQLSVGFWISVFGFLVRLLSKDPVAEACPLLKQPQVEKLERKVAILMPIYNEDVRRVLSGLEASMASLLKACEKEGDNVPARRFDWHVLSDTRKPDVAANEADTFASYSKFCKEARGVNVFYRRREKNTNKKVGNIAEFVQRVGQKYDYMVIFDADSMMSGETLIKMARLMASSPQVGIVQVQAMPVRQASLFGRMFQFSATMFGEMLVQGYSWILLNAGTYIGHNAIIRIHAFKRAANLPVLPGKPPLGGHILSHDHVEAAMMRKAGWEVWFLPDGTGSYEEIPTNLNDFVARDFRWLTGELQHLKLILMPGLPPMSRYQLTFAATHYLGGICWIAMTLVGSQAIAHCDWQDTLCHTLDPRQELFLYAGTLGLVVLLLFGSRILIVLLMLCGKTRAPGGVLRCMISMLLEMVMSTCLAPMFAIITLWSTIKILRGQGSGWDAQDREGRAISWCEISRSLGLYALVSALVPILYFLSGAYNASLTSLPFFVSVILAVPLAKLTSAPKGGGGDWTRKYKLFMSPYEEDEVPEADLDGAEARLKKEVEAFEWRTCLKARPDASDVPSKPAAATAKPAMVLAAKQALPPTLIVSVSESTSDISAAPSTPSLFGLPSERAAERATDRSVTFSVRASSPVSAEGDLRRSKSILLERFSSWESEGHIRVGMRHNNVISHAAEEAAGAKASSEVPLKRTETEAAMLVDLEAILAAEEDVEKGIPDVPPAPPSPGALEIVVETAETTAEIVVETPGGSVPKVVEAV